MNEDEIKQMQLENDSMKQRITTLENEKNDLVERITNLESEKEVAETPTLLGGCEYDY